MSNEILFSRNYSLLVGPRGKEGILIRGLRVVFQIEKSLEPYPNTCNIDIYNLSEKSRSIIEEKRSAVVFSAGYGSNLKTIFVGDIGKVDTKRTGPDLILSIEAGDGRVPYQEARIDASFAEGARMSGVIDTLTAAFGLSKGQVVGINGSDQFQTGLTLSGPVREQFDMLMARQNLQWSIQNNQLQILPPDVSTGEEAVLLNSETGLIGTPFKTKIVNEDLVKKKDGVETVSGVRCTSLMNSEIRPGRKIKLESSTISGVFKVHKVKIHGDTHGTPWYVDIEAR